MYLQILGGQRRAILCLDWQLVVDTGLLGREEECEGGRSGFGESGACPQLVSCTQSKGGRGKKVFHCDSGNTTGPWQSTVWGAWGRARAGAEVLHHEVSVVFGFAASVGGGNSFPTIRNSKGPCPAASGQVWPPQQGISYRGAEQV